MEITRGLKLLLLAALCRGKMISLRQSGDNLSRDITVLNRETFSRTLSVVRRRDEGREGKEESGYWEQDKSEGGGCDKFYSHIRHREFNGRNSTVCFEFPFH